MGYFIKNRFYVIYNDETVKNVRVCNKNHNILHIICIIIIFISTSYDIKINYIISLKLQLVNLFYVAIVICNVQSRMFVELDVI